MIEVIKDFMDSTWPCYYTGLLVGWISTNCVIAFQSDDGWWVGYCPIKRGIPQIDDITIGEVEQWHYELNILPMIKKGLCQA